MPTTATSTAADVARLKFVTTDYLGADALNYDNDPIVRAFRAAGIRGFNSDFIGLSMSDIDDLVDPVTGTRLNVLARCRNFILMGFFHYLCRRKGDVINISNSNRAMYDKYRLKIYDPNKPIVPWSTSLETSNDLIMSAWSKNVRPNKSDYKEFRDEVTWIRSKERFLTTVDAHGLSHLIDPNAKPKNPDLDERQRAWMYKILQDIMVAPTARDIDTSHYTDHDTRTIWKKITEYYDSSMTSQITSQKISSYITSVRYHTSNWRGSQSNWILHYKEQTRLYSEISNQGYTDAQKIQFLNAAVSGMPNLSQILNLHRTASKAASIKTSTYTFEEYVASLLKAASVFDNANTNTRGPRAH